MTIEVTFDGRHRAHQQDEHAKETTSINQSTNQSTDQSTSSSTIHIMRPLTFDTLTSICKEQADHYETMELNDSLRLSYRGIDMLHDDHHVNDQHHVNMLSQYFASLKALHADHNQLDRHCFQHVPSTIQALYIDHNAIDSLENINQTYSLTLDISLSSSIDLSITYYPHLVTLDLSHNPLRSLRGIAGLSQLKSLTANHCELVEADDITSLTRLRDIDLSFNHLPRMENIITSLQSSITSLRVVHLSNNPGVNEFPQYRRSLLSQFNNVRFMDNRPVSDDERAAVIAWADGGFEAEKKVRIDRMEEKRRKQEEQFEAWTVWKNKQLTEQQSNQPSALDHTQSSRRSSIEKRVEYRSVLNEDERTTEQKHEQKHEQTSSVLPSSLPIHSVTPASVNLGEFNVLTSSSADSYLSSVVSMLPSITLSDSSDSDDEELDSVPFLVGLTDVASTHGSSTLIDHAAHAAIRAVIQSSQTPASPSSILSNLSRTITPVPSRFDRYDKQPVEFTSSPPVYDHDQHDVDIEEHKECDDDSQDSSFRWDNDRIHSISSAEPSVTSRSSSQRILVISENENESDEEEGWTNVLDD